MFSLFADKKEALIQFIKFGMVGVFNTLSSTVYYWILLYFHFNYLLATTIAYIIASLIGYLLNNHWVFQSKKVTKTSLFKYYVVYGTSYFLNIFSMFIWVDVLSISKVIAPIFTLFVTVPFNYIFNKIWVFKKGD